LKKLSIFFGDKILPVVALPHALGQPVSGLCDASHGGTIAACLARILEFSFTADFNRFAEVVRLWRS